MLTIDHKEILNAAIESNNGHPLSVDHPLHIMGNLPFNIASPLLLQWLHQQARGEGLFGLGGGVCMTLMFQKEVGDVSQINY